MKKIKWQLVVRKVSDLQPYHKNPRNITEQGLKDLDKSMDKFGLAEPIVINTDNVICGHGKDTIGRARKIYIKKCLVCDNYFRIPPRMIDKRKYCSQKCSAVINAKINGSQKREKVIARNKNLEFIKKVSAGVRKYHKNNPVKEQNWFIKRYGKNYKPKSDYYIPGIEWRRNQKIINGKNICQRCGRKDNLNVHHIIPYAISQDNSPENLNPLCKSCHKIVEDNNLKLYPIIGDWEVLRALYKNHLIDNGRVWDATT